jgi:hypothetical protein
MVELETGFWPDFDRDVEAVTIEKQVPYINLIHLSKEDNTIDSCHLKEEEALEVNRILAEIVQSNHGPLRVQAGP